MERKKKLWLGGSDPDATLERASKAVRCLPASRLLAADLAGSGLGASTSATELAAKTVPATMGEVTAFLSHSWQDEDEAPGAKHAVVARWAKWRQEMTGNEPTLWLVTLAAHRLTAPHPSAPHARTLGKYTLASLCAAGQGVHRPGQHPAVARLLARLPRGLPDAARRGWAHVLLKAVVRHGALHVRAQ